MIRSVNLRPAFYSYYKKDGNSKQESYELCKKKCDSIQDEKLKKNCLSFCEKEYTEDEDEDVLKMSTELSVPGEESDDEKGVLYWTTFSLIWVVVIGVISYTFVRNKNDK